VVLSRVVADVERTGKIGPDERAFLDRAFAEDRAPCIAANIRNTAAIAPA
jgi:hypothetical protein